MAILAAPDARVVPMTPAGGGEAGGRVVVAGSRAALVSSMRPPPPGRTYQAWGLPADGGEPVPLPTFSRPGAVLILDDVERYAKVAVTVEPDGGSARRRPRRSPPRACSGEMNAAVLLVDDDRALRKLVRAYLHEEGIGVLECGSGEEAVELARERRPDARAARRAAARDRRLRGAAAASRRPAWRCR